MCLMIIIQIEKKLNGKGRKIKMVHITKEMVYKLNERLADGGYAVRFKYEVSDLLWAVRTVKESQESMRLIP